jgi:hypothetical protein
MDGFATSQSYWACAPARLPNALQKARTKADKASELLIDPDDFLSGITAPEDATDYFLFAIRNLVSRQWRSRKACGLSEKSRIPKLR